MTMTPSELADARIEAHMQQFLADYFDEDDTIGYDELRELAIIQMEVSE